MPGMAQATAPAGTAQHVIDDFVARGVFRASVRQVDAGETATWHLRWFGGHTMALALAPASVSADPVLPPLDARSALYRDLRAWLRAQQSEDLPAHRRLDPALWQIDVRNRGGAIRLSLRSHQPTPERVRRLVQLVNALYLDFLNGPGRLEWVTDAFGLDPDNPRLS